MATYHAWPCASNSRLARLRRSPAHLRAYLEEPSGDTSATRIGRALHTAVLEPGLFATTFIVAEQCCATTKEGNRCRNQGLASYGIYGWRCGMAAHLKDLPLDALSDTLVALPAGDFHMMQSLQRSIEAHPAAHALLGARTDVELSIVWDDAGTGVRCKARLDALAPSIAGGAIVDVKSARDASPRGFARAIHEHLYECQAAFYLGGAEAVGLEAEHFIFIAAEKEPPYAVAAYRLMESAIDAGRDLVWGQSRAGGLLARYAACLASGQWPAYSDLVTDIALPDYAWAQLDAELAP